MGLDLTVMPILMPLNTWWLGHNRLSFIRNYDLFRQIPGYDRENAMPVFEANPIPPGVAFQNYSDSGIETITEDSWGSPLTYVQSNQFYNLIVVRTATHNHNAAIVQFLASLKPAVPVVLYWH